MIGVHPGGLGGNERCSLFRRCALNAPVDGLFTVGVEQLPPRLAPDPVANGQRELGREQALMRLRTALVAGALAVAALGAGSAVAAAASPESSTQGGTSVQQPTPGNGDRGRDCPFKERNAPSQQAPASSEV
jgi:hypothetical protein